MEIKTLNEQIERLRELIRKCYATVAGKNGTVPEVGERNMENLPAAIASTHDTLKELTITENGEYTPKEGVDGFSKVVAKVVPTIIKLAAISVKDNCIDENGYWPAEMIDTSNITNMYGMFSGCRELRQLDVSSWDTSNVTNMGGMFKNCTSLQQLDISNWDTSKATNMEHMFSGCKQLQQLDTSNWDTSKVISMLETFIYCFSLQQLDTSNWDTSNLSGMYYTFYGCKSLQQLDARNWDASNFRNTSNTFTDCYQLKSLIGCRTIDDVLANNIGAMNGLKISLSLKYTILDRASLRAVINGLADLTGQTAQTLFLGATLMAKLTNEDIAIATNKNWTIV